MKINNKENMSPSGATLALLLRVVSTAKKEKEVFK